MSNQKAAPNRAPGSAIELFAGVGGFRIALERAGFEVSLSNQFEPASKKIQHASSCYVHHFGNEGHYSIDIKVLLDQIEGKSTKLPKVDLVVGGFPCQDYSVAKSLNSAFGLEGKKGVLWWQIHRLLSLQKSANKLPKFVFLENVDRLLKSPSSQRGRDFAIMLRTLGDLGYRVEWRVINAADEGYPQKRKRVFIVAIRRTHAQKIRLDVEDPADYILRRGIISQAFVARAESALVSFELDKNPETISANFNLGVARSPFNVSGFFENDTVYTLKTASTYDGPFGTLGEVVRRTDEEVARNFFVPKDQIASWKKTREAKKIPRRHAVSGFEYEYSEGSMPFPDSLDKPSRTILTAEGGSSPTRFKHIVRIGNKYRRLTPEELEELNGFPRGWTASGEHGENFSDTRRAFFMGNALVVGLVEQIAYVLDKNL